MLIDTWSGARRRALALLGSVAVGLLATSSTARAEDPVVAEPEKSPFSSSFGVDFTSHFISYGADVWGGGDEISPFSPNSTIFAYGTVNVAFTDNLTGFVNVWSDLNDNVNSEIGGALQELDFNTGVTFTYEKFTFTAVHGFWLYAGDEEKIVDLVVGFNDADLITEGFALNPSITAHIRYDGNGGQEEGVAIVPAIKPSFTFMKESDFPVTLAVPVSVAFFSNEFQGGDDWFGYASAGVVGSVPLKFIPEKYGTWSAAAALNYYYTPEDSIPNNPEEHFVVSTITIGVAY